MCYAILLGAGAPPHICGFYSSEVRKQQERKKTTKKTTKKKAKK